MNSKDPQNLNVFYKEGDKYFINGSPIQDTDYYKLRRDAFYRNLATLITLGGLLFFCCTISLLLIIK